MSGKYDKKRRRQHTDQTPIPSNPNLCAEITDYIEQILGSYFGMYQKIPPGSEK